MPEYLITISTRKTELFMLLKPPIGSSDFKKLREKDHYYVDKSLLIKDILEDSAEILLFPRLLLK